MSSISDYVRSILDQLAPKNTATSTNSVIVSDNKVDDLGILNENKTKVSIPDGTEKNVILNGNPTSTGGVIKMNSETYMAINQHRSAVHIWPTGDGVMVITAPNISDTANRKYAVRTIKSPDAFEFDPYEVSGQAYIPTINNIAFVGFTPNGDHLVCVGAEYTGPTSEEITFSWGYVKDFTRDTDISNNKTVGGVRVRGTYVLTRNNVTVPDTPGVPIYPVDSSSIDAACPGPCDIACSSASNSYFSTYTDPLALNSHQQCDFAYPFISVTETTGNINPALNGLPIINSAITYVWYHQKTTWYFNSGSDSIWSCTLSDPTFGSCTTTQISNLSNSVGSINGFTLEHVLTSNSSFSFSNSCGGGSSSSGSSTSTATFIDNPRAEVNAIFAGHVAGNRYWNIKKGITEIVGIQTGSPTLATHVWRDEKHYMTGTFPTPTLVDDIIVNEPEPFISGIFSSIAGPRAASILANMVGYKWSRPTFINYPGEAVAGSAAYFTNTRYYTTNPVEWEAAALGKAADSEIAHVFRAFVIDSQNRIKVTKWDTTDDIQTNKDSEEGPANESPWDQYIDWRLR